MTKPPEPVVTGELKPCPFCGFSSQTLTTVTQADRDLFKMIITGMVGPTRHNAIDGGGFDSDERMQAIALHRTANALPGDALVEAYLIERIEGEGYGPARSIVDANKYDPTKDAFWVEDAQNRHRVTPLAALTPSALSGDAGEGE